MPTKSAPFKIGAKVAGMYNEGGLRWDPSGIVTACDDKSVTVHYRDGIPRVYTLPASDFIDHLRICTACGKPGTFKHCIGNSGCGAPTKAA